MFTTRCHDECELHAFSKTIFNTSTEYYVRFYVLHFRWWWLDGIADEEHDMLLTDNFAFGATVMSLIGSHISFVECERLFGFSSKVFGSRKNVTAPMFLCVSLAVNFDVVLVPTSDTVFFDVDKLRFVVRMFTRSRNIRLPCRFSDLYVPLIPVYDCAWRFLLAQNEKNCFYYSD